MLTYHLLNGIRNKPKLDFLSDIKPEMGVEPFVKINISKYECSLLAQMRYGILQIQLETGGIVMRNGKIDYVKFVMRG